MASSWKETTLGAVTSWSSGGTPKKDDPSFWGGDIPWISANSMHSTRFSDSDLRLTELGLQNGSRLAPTDSVLLLVRGGALHKRIPVGIALRDVAFNQDVKALVAQPEKIRPWYLLFWLMGMESSLLDSVVEYTGIGAGKLETTRMQALVLELPPLQEQDAIVAMLKSIDDQIHLLRQTIVTLEAIAQALFKSWFVDFDPARAKAEGREPEGMDADTAALFPGELEESELGLIPRGWSIRAVGDVATIIRGRSYKSSELADSDTALVTLKSFNRGGGFRRDGFKPYTGQFKSEQEVFEGDCIVAHTDVTQQAELIGRSAVVTRSPFYSRLVASLDVGIVRPKTDELTSIFLSALLSGDRYVSHIKGYTSGTTVLHLSKDGLPGFRFACPSPGLVKAYSDLAFAMFQRQATNIAIQETLAELRDTLLPRLISGKLRLPEAEKTVEESVA